MAGLSFTGHDGIEIRDKCGERQETTRKQRPWDSLPMLSIAMRAAYRSREPGIAASPGGRINLWAGEHPITKTVSMRHPQVRAHAGPTRKPMKPLHKMILGAVLLTSIQLASTGCAVEGGGGGGVYYGGDPWIDNDVIVTGGGRGWYGGGDHKDGGYVHPGGGDRGGGHNAGGGHSGGGSGGGHTGGGGGGGHSDPGHK